jgi:hypothetical protein
MADSKILIATFKINDGVAYNTHGFNHLGHRNVSSEETAELSHGVKKILSLNFTRFFKTIVTFPKSHIFIMSDEFVVT